MANQNVDEVEDEAVIFFFIYFLLVLSYWVRAREVHSVWEHSITIKHSVHVCLWEKGGLVELTVSLNSLSWKGVGGGKKGQDRGANVSLSYLMCVWVRELHMQLQPSQPWHSRESDKGWGPRTKARKWNKISIREHFYPRQPLPIVVLLPFPTFSNFRGAKPTDSVFCL